MIDNEIKSVDRMIQKIRNDGYDEAVDLIESLSEERDAALADAERYRWLKSGGKAAVGYLELMSSSDVWDAAIDSAKSEF